MEPLSSWDNFYIIMGAATGALIGLQFVVMALIAERPPPRASDAGAAFATPTVVHFSAVLLVSGLISVPWHSSTPLLVLSGIVGACGAGYAKRHTRMRG